MNWLFTAVSSRAMIIEPLTNVGPGLGVRLSIFVIVGFLLSVLAAVLWLRMREADKEAGIK